MSEPATTRDVIARCMWQLHAAGYRFTRVVDFGGWRHYWLRRTDAPFTCGVHLSAPRKQASEAVAR